MVRDRGALVSRKARAILEYLDFRPVEELCASGVLAAARGRESVLAKKIASVKDAVTRIRAVLPASVDAFASDRTSREVVVLNLVVVLRVRCYRNSPQSSGSFANPDIDEPLEPAPERPPLVRALRKGTLRGTLRGCLPPRGSRIESSPEPWLATNTGVPPRMSGSRREDKFRFRHATPTLGQSLR